MKVFQIVASVRQRVSTHQQVQLTGANRLRRISNDRWVSFARLAVLAMLMALETIAMGAEAVAGQRPEDEALASRLVDVRAHEQVFERVEELVDEAGETALITNRWNVIVPGAGYWSETEQKWLETKERIRVVEDGAVHDEGPFRVKFPATASGGPIQLTMVDGRVMKVQTRGIVLTDSGTSDSVWIAVARDVAGQVQGNTITYPGAFTGNGVTADLKARITVGRFESDIALKTRLVDPQLLGMAKEKTYIEVFHEIVEMPEGTVKAASIPRADGTEDVDQQVDFVELTIGPGNAFLVGADGARTAEAVGSAVAKEHFRTTDPETGRPIHYMIERVKYIEAEASLNALPAAEEAALDIKELKETLEKNRSVAGKPGGASETGARLAVRPQARRAPVKMAGLDAKGESRRVALAPGAPEYLIDYTTVVTASNFTFKGSENYLVNSSATLSGTTRLEGGAVIRYGQATNNGPTLTISGDFECLTSEYNPATFTSISDNSIGDKIDTNAISGFYGQYHLLFTGLTNKIDLHNVRTRYAYNGFGFHGTNSHRIGHVQALHAYRAIESVSNTVNVRNLLAHNVTNVFSGTNATVRAEHVTAHNGAQIFWWSGSGNLYLTNSLLVAMTGASTNVSQDHVANLASDVGVFGSAWAAEHYLSLYSPYRSAGTTNITSLSEIRKRTTLGPIFVGGAYANRNLGLIPALLLEESGNPDLGYAYDRLDYFMSGLSIQNGTIYMTNGAAAAWSGTYAVRLLSGGKFASAGTPTRMNRLVRYQLVQEQPVLIGNAGTSSVFLTTNNISSSSRPEVNLRFIQLSLWGAGATNRNFASGGYFKNLAVSHSHLQNVDFTYGAGTETTVTHLVSLTNNVLERCTFDVDRFYNTSLTVSVWNNLFTKGVFDLTEPSGAPSYPISIKDNLFDAVTLTFSGHSSSTNFAVACNAYYSTTSLPANSGSSNVTLTAVNFTNGYLGRFYSPGTGALTNVVDKGSRDAGAAGLRHFTMTADQVAEGTSRGDIGFHYLALNPSDGTLPDEDGDGLDVTQEDKNLNGFVDSGETNYADADSDGDSVPDRAELEMEMDALDAGERRKLRLGYWPFRTDDFKAQTGQPKYTMTNVTLTTEAASVYAARMANATNSNLQYLEVQPGIGFSIARGRGTVRMWFNPDWNTSVSDIFSPSNPGQLISMGRPTAEKSNYWSLRFSPKGDALIFESQANGIARTNLNASINWASSDWYQVTVTYDTNISKLYINGTLVQTSTNGVGPVVPSYAIRANEKICVGCIGFGGGVAFGDYDEIETFNYPLSAEEIERGYPGAYGEDTDRDGILDWVEGVNGLKANKRDSDDDGMPDGFEFYAARYKPSGYTGALLNPLSADGNLDSDGDSISNLNEYLLGLNPYVADPPWPVVPGYVPLLATNLINLDFGTNNVYAGPAYVGVTNIDHWNKVGIGGAIDLRDAASNVVVTAPKVQLITDLGHLVKNILNCEQPEDRVLVVDPIHEALSVTNTYADILCEDPLTLTSTRSQMTVEQASAWLRELWSYRHPGFDGPGPWNEDSFDLWNQSRNESWNMADGGGFFINRPPLQADYATRFLSGEAVSFPLYGETCRAQLVTKVVTPPVPPGRISVDPPGFGEQRKPEIVERLNIARGIVTQFDEIETIAATNNLMYFDGVHSSFLMAKLPVGDECNEYQFLRDGHARITVGPLPHGDYLVYAYAGSDTESGSVQMWVNGAPLTAPIARNVTGGFRLGVNCGVAAASTRDGWLDFQFATNQSLISGMQLVRLAGTKLAAPVIDSVRVTHHRKAVVRWRPVPGALGYEVIQTNITMGISTNVTERNRKYHLTPVGGLPPFAISDGSYNVDCDTAYYVRALSGEAKYHSDWTLSATTPAFDPPGDELSNHAPTIQNYIHLHGAFQDMTHSIGAADLIASSNAEDIDGNPLSFVITKLLAGTLKFQDTNGVWVALTESMMATNSYQIGGKEVFRWEPPAGVTGEAVPAFEIAASDGEFLSTERATVLVEIEPTRTLMWWGNYGYGYAGNGRLPSVAVKEQSAFGAWAAWIHNEEPSPVLVASAFVTNDVLPHLTNVVQVAGSSRVRLALRGDGTVWSWGSSIDGQLGDGARYFPAGGEPNNVPWYTKELGKATLVTNLVNARSIAAGEMHAVAVKADGTVWGWGNNDQGQLGEAKVELYSGFPYHNGNSDPFDDLLYQGLATPEPSEIPGLKDIVMVAASGWATLALDAKGEVYFLGEWSVMYPSDAEGFTSSVIEGSRTPLLKEIPDVSGRVVKIAAHDDYFLALTSDGLVYSFGSNAQGGLGRSLGGGSDHDVNFQKVENLSGVRDIAAGKGFALAALANGKIMEWGIESPLPRRRYGPENVVAVAATLNGANGFAMDRSRRLFGWGDNFFELLDGEGVNRTLNTPSLVGGVEEMGAFWSDGVTAYTTMPASLSGPRGLVSVAKDREIALSWRKYPGAIAYEVQRSREQFSEFGVAGMAPADDTAARAQFSDVNLTNGLPYYYRVRALLEGGESEFSKTIVATPTPAPGSVTNFASAALNRMIKLTWNPASRATEYEIYRKKNNGEFQFWKQVMDGGLVSDARQSSENNLNTTFDTGLAASDTYRYVIRAKNPAGYGSWSSVVGPTNAVTDAFTATVQDLVMTTNASNGALMQLTWNAPDQTFLDDPQGIYWVKVFATGTNGWEELVSTYETATGTARFDSLKAGQRHRFEVTAVDDRGESSGVSTNWTYWPPYAYVPPLTILATNSGNGFFYVKWKGSAFQYLVNVPGTTCVNHIVDPDENGIAEFFLTGLGAGTHTSVIYQILSDAAPANGTTNQFAVTSGSSTALPAMSAIPADNRMTISWWGTSGQMAGNLQAFEGWRFILQRKEEANPAPYCPGWWTICDGISMGVNDGEVENGRAYKYRVYGISPVGEVVLQTMGTNEFIPKVTFPGNEAFTLSVTNKNGGLSLGWNALTNAHGYLVGRGITAGGPYGTIALLEPGILTLDDRDLVNDQSYYYIITATNVNGDTLTSNEGKGVPSEDAGLLPASGFVASIHLNQLFLSWHSVMGADRYAIWETNTLLQSVKAPEVAVSYTNQTQFKYAVVAHRRSLVATQEVTIEPICWSAQVGAAYYEVGITNAGTFTLLATTDETHFEPVRLGNYGTLANYLVIARGSDDSVIAYNVSWTSRLNQQLPTATLDPETEARIEIVGLSTNVGSPFVVQGPTNIVLRVEVGLKGEKRDTNWIKRVEYYLGGQFLAAATEQPYSHEWINPKGSVAGTAHQIQAILVSEDLKTASSSINYVTVKVQPELTAFTTAAMDLQIPAPGLPLTLSRSYDSRNLAVGLLGKGWKLDWERSMVTMGDLSSGWMGVPHPLNANSISFLESKYHFIEVMIHGGVERFRPGMAPYTPVEFDFDDGTFSSVYSFGLDYFGVDGAVGQLTENPARQKVDVFIQRDANTEPIDLVLRRRSDPVLPDSLIYTSADGMRMWFGNPVADNTEFRRFGVTAMGDRFGNKITITNVPGLVTLTHSNGRQIWMDGATSGAQTTWSVYDPAELALSPGSRVPVLKYVVSNLFLIEAQQIRDRGAGTYDKTFYSYDAAGRLAHIAGPDGVVLLSNKYDENNFLTNQTDAAGLQTSIAIGVDGAGNAQLEISQNAPGATNVAGYGPGGELTSMQPDSGDAGSKAQVLYDSNGQPSYELAPDGSYTSYEYDRAGRPVAIVDGEGNRSSTVFGRYGGPAYTSDALGNGSAFEYYTDTLSFTTNVNEMANPEGALRMSVDASGLKTTYTYNFQGQVLSETREAPEGGVPLETRYEYENNGDLARTLQRIAMNGTAPIYWTNHFTYDLNGNRLTEIKRRHFISRTGGTNATLSTEFLTNSFAYDARNRLLRSTNALGEVSISVFDAKGKAVASTNVLGHATTHLYDARGNLIQTTYPDGTASRSVFDQKGRALWSQERCVLAGDNTTGPASETVYDSRGRVSLIIRHENTTFQKSVQASTNETAAFTAGAFYRLLTGFSATNYTMSVTSTGAVASITRTDYDAAGRVKFAVNALGGVTAYGYDLAGRRTSVTNYLTYALTNIASQSITPPTNSFVVSQTGYDANGNQKWAVDGNGNRTDFHYDRLNRKVITEFPLVSGDSVRRTQWSVFDGLGRRTAEVDEAGVWTAFQYDLLGRLVAVTNDFRLAYTEDQRPFVARYAYDELGNMTNEVKEVYTTEVTFKDADVDASETAVTRFEYDKLGRRTLRFLPAIPPNLDDTTNNASMEKTEYARIGSGPYTLRKTVRDFRGITITNDFDSMDRLVTRVLPPVNPSFEVLRTQVYDYTGPLLTQVRETGTNWARTNYYAYDDSRRLRRKDTPESVFTYSYAPNGQVGGINMWRRGTVAANAEPGGGSTNDFQMAYGYDPLSRLSKVTNSVGTNVWVTSYTFDSAGNIDLVSGPEIKHDYGYNQRNQLKTLSVSRHSGTVHSTNLYYLDPAGRRTRADEYTRINSTSETRRSVYWGYDQGLAAGRPELAPKLYRLAHEDIYDTNGTRLGTISHQYDRRGNRDLRQSDTTPIQTDSWSFDLNDRLTSTGFVYDANGNPINSPTNIVTSTNIVDYYDAENRLIKRTAGNKTITIGYDHEGNRVWKHVNNSGSHLNTYYSVDTVNPTGYAQVIGDYVDNNSTVTPNSGALSRGYEYGHSLLSLWHNPSLKYYYAYDGAGNIRYLVAGSGVLVTTYVYDYDGYGNLLSNPSGLLIDSYRHKGRQWDKDLGAYYDRARFSDPNLARFLTADSFEGSSSDPMSLHKYLYCAADPVNRIDASGHFSLVETLSANKIRVALYGIAGLTIAHYATPKFIAKYDTSPTALADPEKPFRRTIISAARANRLDPAFLAAIIATELDDLNFKDWTFDAAGWGLGTTAGWAQITERNSRRIYPDFGFWKRYGMALRPESSIRMAARLIRVVADEGAKNSNLADFKCNGGTVHPPDFAQDGLSWTEAMMCAAAYNYTQTEWLIEVNRRGERDMVFHPKAGGYGVGAIAHYREFKGKFDE